MESWMKDVEQGRKGLWTSDFQTHVDSLIPREYVNVIVLNMTDST